MFSVCIFLVSLITCLITCNIIINTGPAHQCAISNKTGKNTFFVVLSLPCLYVYVVCVRHTCRAILLSDEVFLLFYLKAFS